MCIRDSISTISEKFGGLQADRSDAQQRIEDYSREISQISHFTGMALDLDSIRECSYIKVCFGFIPKESFEKLKHYDQNPYIIFFPCSSDDEHYWGIYFSPVDQVSEVDRIFSSLYFQRVRLAELKDTPEQMCIRDRPFIVLDEPTAALDPISEYEIYTRFNEIVGDKTAVFISHRLSSCRFCDDIAVFNKGELVQRGSHDVLLADEKGKYYELWHAQAQYYT